MSDFNKNIKHKLGQHEFDFNPKSWDNMEALLDGNRTPKKSYFKTKTILIMTTLLFFLVYLLSQQGTPPLGNFNTPKQTMSSIQAIQNLDSLNAEYPPLN